MSENAPVTESLEDKGARWLNIGMVGVLGFLMFCTFGWAIYARWPSVLAVLRSEPGADFGAISPLILVLCGLLNVALSIRNSQKVKHRIVYWIADLAAWFVGVLLWSGAAWLLFAHRHSLWSVIRGREGIDFFGALFVVLFVLLTIVPVVAILKRLARGASARSKRP